MKITENNFIKEMKKGNEDSLMYVIDNYGGLIKTIINKHLFYLDAYKEECISDCFLAIWENIESYDETKSEFKNWVAGIAKYKSIDYIRRYLREKDNISFEDISEDSFNNKDSLDIILEKEFNNQVKELLSYLSKEDQNIFIETYFNGKSAEEISINNNLSSSNIYNRLSRGRRKLKNLYGGKKWVKKYMKF